MAHRLDSPLDLRFQAVVPNACFAVAHDVAIKDDVPAAPSKLHLRDWA
jgi:hypothetical protein